MFFIDFSTESCPIPLVKIKLKLKQMKAMQSLQVHLSDIGSRQDVPKFCQKQGHKVEIIEANDELLSLVITKREQ